MATPDPGRNGMEGGDSTTSSDGQRQGSGGDGTWEPQTPGSHNRLQPLVWNSGWGLSVRFTELPWVILMNSEHRKLLCCWETQQALCCGLDYVLWKRTFLSAPPHREHSLHVPVGLLVQGPKQNSDCLALEAIIALILALLLCKLYPLS